MKHFIQTLGLGAALCATAAMLTPIAPAQKPLSADHVMIPVEIKPANNQEPVFNLVGIPCHRPTALEGTLTQATSTSGGNTIFSIAGYTEAMVLDGFDIANDEYNASGFDPAGDGRLNTNPHTLLITGGPSIGLQLEIVDTNGADGAETVTVRGTGYSLPVDETTWVIIPDWTLNTLLGSTIGELPAGFAATPVLALADTIQIFYTDGVRDIYYHNGTEWTIQGEVGTNVGNWDVFPALTEGFFLVRSNLSSQAFTLYLSGEVYQSQVNAPIPGVFGGDASGFSILGNINPYPINLKEFGTDSASLNEVIKSSNIAALADTVRVLSGNELVTLYYDPTFSGGNWRRLSDLGLPSASQLTIQPGEAIFIDRTNIGDLSTYSFAIQQEFPDVDNTPLNPALQ